MQCFTYNYLGQLTVGTGSHATTSYSYDASGDTTAIRPPSGRASNLTWNDAGQLSTITVGTSQTPTAAYTYDASGSLLLQTDPGAGTATLYLPDEQLTATTSGTTTTVSGIRYYTIGGVTTAARTSGGTIDYLTGDQQGTSMLAVNAATLVPARRYYDPFGNPVGTPPATWPGTKGFVGGTADPATGLTNLGAREYNPATATFISTDAILDPFNPQDFNPYAYAADSPVSNSDPTGLMCVPGEAVADCNDHRTADQNGDDNGNSNGTADGPPGDEGTPLTCPTPSVPAGQPDCAIFLRLLQFGRMWRRNASSAAS